MFKLKVISFDEKIFVRLEKSSNDVEVKINGVFETQNLLNELTSINFNKFTNDISRPSIFIDLTGATIKDFHDFKELCDSFSRRGFIHNVWLSYAKSEGLGNTLKELGIPVNIKITENQLNDKLKDIIKKYDIVGSKLSFDIIE